VDVYERMLGSDRFPEAFIRPVVFVRCVLFFGLVGLDQLGQMNWFLGGEDNGDD
jgi:hypothetical protein